MSEKDDLRQQRQALQVQLDTLTDARERAQRTNGDALSLQQNAGPQRSETEMQALAHEVTAGDSAMTELRREIEKLDDQIAQTGGVGHRLMGRLRR
jgi:chromosome segregation ATPase